MPTNTHTHTQEIRTFDMMFQISAAVFSDGKFSGKFEAPVCLKAGTRQLFVFIYLYLFTLHVFFFNIADLN